MAYDSYIAAVPGDGKNTLMLYTLSTCIWCKKTKALLKQLGAGYKYVDVDLVGSDAREAVLKDFRKYNPAQSYPTIVVNGGKDVIIGFQEDRVRELCGKR
jgi:glutaredoxin-like protein NrdH